MKFNLTKHEADSIIGLLRVAEQHYRIGGSDAYHEHILKLHKKVCEQAKTGSVEATKRVWDFYKDDDL